ncbi:MAG: hypothetical protein JWM81_498 [Candidatus Saccharibacteria bacterium]|nr:hypothetical protein [Candidatus Saccharibacteria bacterium]
MNYEFGRRFDAPRQPIRDKDAVIPGQWLWPHYTNPAFDSGVSVYLHPAHETTTAHGLAVVDGATYLYSDRLPVDYDKLHQAGEQVARELGTNESAHYFEAMLQRAMEDPELQLVHLITGVNRGNGFPYHVYGIMHDPVLAAPAPTKIPELG